MELIQAVSTRRSIRRYQDKQVSKNLLDRLLEAAILAPSASNSQPWSFAVLQDLDLLQKYSDRAKNHLLNLVEREEKLRVNKPALSNPDFNIFYNAGILIVIYATSDQLQAIGSCFLAAQNLMLTAHDLELGTCWIGFAQPYLNSAELKNELGIPTDYVAVAPLIVGYPEISPPQVCRKAPNIIVWK